MTAVLPPYLQQTADQDIRTIVVAESRFHQTSMYQIHGVYKEHEPLEPKEVL